MEGKAAALNNYSERQIEETRFLAGNIFVKASKDYPLTDCRHYWKLDPHGDFVPTTKIFKLNRKRLEILKTTKKL